MTVPGSWYALSNGRLLETRRTRRHPPLPLVPGPAPSTYLFTLAAGDSPGSTTARRLKSTISWRRRTRRRAPHVRPQPEMVSLFERLFDAKYPCRSTRKWWCATLFSVEWRTPRDDDDREHTVRPQGGEDFNRDGLISHELAHQWFGDLLTAATGRTVG